MDISIPIPPDFSFERTVMSHGWCELSPFEFDRESWKLVRVLEIDKGRPVTVTITGAQDSIEVRSLQKAGARDGDSITRHVRHIFRLDDELAEFYKLIGNEPVFSWIARVGAGRLLRSPSVYEDLVKTICTTNCSWALTKKMVSGLVTMLGRETGDKRHAFPTPAAMASAPEKFYRDEVRAGYRASYLLELAERVASGSLDVEGWLNSALPTFELKRQIKSVKGAGDYAAENLLKLLGRYDGLALDSWLRAKFARTHNKGRVAADAKIARHYSRFGAWCGLAMWCDMTRDWLDDASVETAEGAAAGTPRIT